ncbi:MAG: hypothetical protein COV72_03450, partial [Candidatus Omnitrophica bacterium CG11_big_fil_rev_8_21_14_0_20_42_13]
KILYLSVGDRSVASSRTRVYSFVPYLKSGSPGIKARVICYTPSWQCRRILAMQRLNIAQKICAKAYSGAIILSLMAAAPFFDVICIQKVILSRFNMAVLKILNGRIVFDFDDAIYMKKDITHMLRAASCVIVSNNYLREFALKYNPKVYKMISPVKVEGGVRAQKGDEVRLGWIGLPETSAYLYPVLPVLGRLKNEFGNLKMEFMGCAKNGDFDLLGIRCTAWSLDAEKDYLGSLDIGIMPLFNDRWAQGKGGYKLLQYMAMGIPCVASPVGVNREIIKDGINGFLADDEKEWHERLSRLIKNPALRGRMGGEGRRMARELYSYET